MTPERRRRRKRRGRQSGSNQAAVSPHDPANATQSVIPSPEPLPSHSDDGRSKRRRRKKKARRAAVALLALLEEGTRPPTLSAPPPSSVPPSPELVLQSPINTSDDRNLTLSRTPSPSPRSRSPDPFPSSPPSSQASITTPTRGPRRGRALRIPASRSGTLLNETEHSPTPSPIVTPCPPPRSPKRLPQHVQASPLEATPYHQPRTRRLPITPVRRGGVASPSYFYRSESEGSPCPSRPAEAVGHTGIPLPEIDDDKTPRPTPPIQGNPVEPPTESRRTRDSSPGSHATEEMATGGLGMVDSDESQFEADTPCPSPRLTQARPPGRHPPLPTGGSDIFHVSGGNNVTEPSEQSDVGRHPTSLNSSVNSKPPSSPRLPPSIIRQREPSSGPSIPPHGSVERDGSPLVASLEIVSSPDPTPCSSPRQPVGARNTSSEATTISLDSTPCPSPRTRQRLPGGANTSRTLLGPAEPAPSQVAPVAEPLETSSSPDSTPCPSPRPVGMQTLAPSSSSGAELASSQGSFSSMDSTPCPSPRIERFFTPVSTFSSRSSSETAPRAESFERFYTPASNLSPTPFYTPASTLPRSPTPRPSLGLEMPSSIAVSDVLRVWEAEMGEPPASESEAGGEDTPRASRTSYSPTPSTQVLSRFPTSSPPLDPTSQLPSHLESQLDPFRSELHPTSERLSEQLASPLHSDAPTDIPDVFSDMWSERPSPSPQPLPYIRDVQPPIKGFHVSSDGGIQALTLRASGLLGKGIAHGIQCFAGSPRRQRIPEYGEDEIRSFKGMDRRWWTLHASHTTNLASADEKTATRGMAFVAAEMATCNRLGIPTLCVHLGSDVAATDERVVVARVARALGELLASIPRVTLALENMIRASVCRQPWSLRTLSRILDAVDSPRLKVCVDVCHAYIAEFDLAGDGLGDMMSVLAREVGWHRVAGVHVSDSATAHGSKCEGHANIGDGLIPLNAFRSVLRSPLLGSVPYYLETPAYSPARPAYYPAIGGWEARRRVAEWDFLERLVCMSSHEWGVREKDEVAMYRRERERCEMAIRNLLRGEMWAVVDRGAGIQEAFREMRQQGRARAAKIRWVRQKRDGDGEEEQEKTPTKRRHSDYYAGLEAAASSPSSFTSLGGYTLRRRIKAES